MSKFYDWMEKSIPDELKLLNELEHSDYKEHCKLYRKLLKDFHAATDIESETKRETSDVKGSSCEDIGLDELLHQYIDDDGDVITVISPRYPETSL